MSFDVVVIGAGPAGLLAAGKAAFDGASVLLLEKKKAPGSKLLLTGNGRCNVTNHSKRLHFQSKLLAGSDFMEMPLKLFSPAKFLIFLEGLGISYGVEQDNRVFPEENSAVKVRDALRNWAVKCGVTIKTRAEVSSVESSNGEVTGVTYLVENKEESVKSPSVIIATGGLSYPETGSTGDGYQFAEQVGHSIVPPVAALVPLKLADRNVMEPLQGVVAKDARIYLWSEGKKMDDRKGDILFTHFGISSPAVLDISRKVSELTSKKEKMQLTLDFIPHIDDADLDKELVQLFENNGKKELVSILKEYVLPKVANYLVKHICKLDSSIKGAEINGKMRKLIRAALKRCELPLIGTLPVEKATVTAGGVSCEEVNAETMESYILSGLYFAGEVLNIDGYCGGFNLQVAYSTGRLAGSSAAKSVKDIS